eukprot:gene4758-9463_t
MKPNMNICDAFANGISTGKSTRFKRMASSLRWRQSFQNSESYPLLLDNGRILHLNQIINGEINGFGTGANVWPAAHILGKYFEKEYNTPAIANMRIVDIGTGTGCTGLIAAILGAKVVLTDLDCILCLTAVNSKRCIDDFNIPPENITLLNYDWGQSCDHLNPPFDIILISDCILPKLYPMEPLIKAVSSIMNNDSIALFSYEHRIYPYFDPRQEFRRLLKIYGLHMKVIPIEDHHDIYCSDEVEIWEVRKITTSTNIIATTPTTSTTMSNISTGLNNENPNNNNHNNNSNTSNTVEVISWTDVEGNVNIRMNHMDLTIQQKNSNKNTRNEKNNSSSDNDNDSSGKSSIGAGCGLTSMALCSMGYGVIATDKKNVLDNLRENIQNFLEQYNNKNYHNNHNHNHGLDHLSSSDISTVENTNGIILSDDGGKGNGKDKGSIHVLAFDWNTMLQETNQVEGKESGKNQHDKYSKLESQPAVEPLLCVLDK